MLNDGFHLLDGQSVGPVVTLSYKHHALDEFLVDLVRLDPTLKPGQLIRCGNVEHHELLKFKEKSSPSERGPQRTLETRVRAMRTAQRAIRDWRDLASVLDIITAGMCAS